MSTTGAIELEELSILESQRAMTSGEATACSLTEQYLERIGELDENGPKVNSVIELNPDALAIAGALDKDPIGYDELDPSDTRPCRGGRA